MKITLTKTVSRVIHESNEFFDNFLVVFNDLSTYECGCSLDLPLEIRKHIVHNKPTCTNIEVDDNNIDSPYTTYKYIYDIENM